MQVLGQDSGSGGGPNVADLLRQARRGFRSDVARLLEALEHADMLIPLAEPLPAARVGERTKIEGELRLLPHFMRAADGATYAVLFTIPELLEAAAVRLGWTTGGGELEFCAVPGGVALEMARGTLDSDVRGLVIDPGADSELVLSAFEVERLASGQAIPLVGYVRALSDDRERTLVAEAGDPPAPQLLQALAECRSQIDELLDFELLRTYNPERDLEPHATLKLCVAAGVVDHARIAERIFERIGPLLPPPGYIDIVFADPSP
jgi:hypothetical protein